MLVGLAWLALLLAGCGRIGSDVDVFVDGIEWIRFGGLEYSGGSANGYAVREVDLTEIGEVEAVEADVQGPTVFALRGVAPTSVVIMRSPVAEGGYRISFETVSCPALSSPTWRRYRGCANTCPTLSRPANWGVLSLWRVEGGHRAVLQSRPGPGRRSARSG